MIAVKQDTDKILADIIAIRNDLHENPELSLQEFNTSKKIKDYIEKHIPYHSLHQVGETGWLLGIKGEKAGDERVIGFRGDIDALPVQEAGNMYPKSKIPGVMHACGHDVHTVINLGAAQVLAQNTSLFAGTVYFFFQPAEEILKGALLFLDDEKVPMDTIDAMVGLHVSPEINAGQIGVRYGAILASADEIKIVVKGKGGHGAHPHTVVDPIVAAASLIMNLQTMVSREISAPDSAVVSICMIEGGTAHNIIPDQVVLKGTVRTLSPAIRDQMEASLNRIAQGIGTTLRTTIEVEYIRGVPPLVCEADWVDRAIHVGNQLLGEENVVILPVPSMGGDDFAFLKENRDGVFIRLGARTPGGPYGSMHSSTFYCDDAAVAAGIKTIAGIALDYFGEEYC